MNASINIQIHSSNFIKTSSELQFVNFHLMVGGGGGGERDHRLSQGNTVVRP